MSSLSVQLLYNKYIFVYIEMLLQRDGYHYSNGHPTSSGKLRRAEEGQSILTFCHFSSIAYST